MASKDATLPPLVPSGPGQPVQQPIDTQKAPEPDIRDIAASSHLPNVPVAVSASSKLSTITAALGYNRFHDSTFGISSMVPNFMLFSWIISALDRTMLNTYRFGQSSPDWHPLLTQIYYGIVFVVHILRVRRSAQTITADEYTFLEWFEGTFPLSSLPIAGPLKHFLQSITVCSGPSKFYGNIAPDTPSSWTLTAANAFTFGAPDLHFNSCFPAIRYLLDEIVAMTDAAQHQANFDPNNAEHWRRFHLPFNNVFGAATANEHYFSFPGFTGLLPLPATQMVTFFHASQGTPYPPRVAAAAGNMTSIAEFCGLANHGVQQSAWFPIVVNLMQRHAQFFKDSTSLANISTVGLGAHVPTVTPAANPHLSLVNAAAGQLIVPVAAVAAVPAAGGAPATPAVLAGWRATARPHHLRVAAASRMNTLHLLAEQFSLLSCVNIDFTGLAARGGNYHALPAAANVRQGPLWNLPVVKTHAEIDVYNQIVTFLVATFHSDTRFT
uniref:Putative capsid protein n=1 Tax=Heterobasidion partitivirus 11 TaxID=2172534 RepID=A0A2S1B7E6_9VIRU|nr:putative capsid protein [Heterobasidion partitivirus 11]